MKTREELVYELCSILDRNSFDDGNARGRAEKIIDELIVAEFIEVKKPQEFSICTRCHSVTAEHKIANCCHKDSIIKVREILD